MDSNMKREDRGFGMQPEPKTTVSDTAPSTATDSSGGTGGVGGDSSVIQWSDKNFDGVAPDTHVYDTSLRSEIKIDWSSDVKNIEYTKISIAVVDGTKGDSSDYDVRREFSFDNHSDEGDGGTSGTPDFFQSLDKDGGADMEIDQFGSKDIPFEKIYAIQLDWTDSDNDMEGKSWSPWFSVVDGTETATKDEAAKKMQQKLDDIGEDKTQGFEETDSSKTSPDIITTTDSNGNMATITGSSSSTNTPSVSSGKGGGLSAGAIAGIAVGGFVFLCLIGVLVWFLMRRRRKNKARTGAYAGDASNTYIADKTDEVVVTADPQSPHSPYSDDGQNQHAPMDPNARHFDTPNDNAAAAWSRDGSHDQSRGIHDPDSPVGANSTQASEGGNYRHLVEEGMSADDIRRLEEEERQLDDAIERAGRR